MHRLLPGWIATPTMTSLSPRRGYSLADPRRERYLAEASVDSARYVGSLPQLFERDAGINRTVLVEVAGQMPSQNDAPIEWNRRCNGAHHVKNRGGAVCCNGVVESRVCGKIVCLFDIFNKQGAGALRRCLKPIKLDLLVADLAQRHQITLIGSDIHQLVSLEESGNGRILVILRPSQLDREIEIAPVLETEAHNRVGNRRSHPINQKQIERSQF